MFGVAVLATVFSVRRLRVAETFVDGLQPAIWVGAVAAGVGALISLAIPRAGAGRKSSRSRQRGALEVAQRPALTGSTSAYPSPRKGTRSTSVAISSGGNGPPR